MMMNTGDKPIATKNSLLTTIAWRVDNKVHYALEGSIFIAGAVVQWLRDSLGIIRKSADVEKLASKVNDSEGVFFIPAFAGMKLQRLACLDQVQGKVGKIFQIRRMQLLGPHQILQPFFPVAPLDIVPADVVARVGNAAAVQFVGYLFPEVFLLS